MERLYFPHRLWEACDYYGHSVESRLLILAATGGHGCQQPITLSRDTKVEGLRYFRGLTFSVQTLTSQLLCVFQIHLNHHLHHHKLHHCAASTKNHSYKILLYKKHHHAAASQSRKLFFSFFIQCCRKKLLTFKKRKMSLGVAQIRLSVCPFVCFHRRCTTFYRNLQLYKFALSTICLESVQLNITFQSNQPLKLFLYKYVPMSHRACFYRKSLKPNET